MSEELAAFDLGRGELELDAALASDLDVVNAARVSFAQSSDELGEREVGLIGYLMRNGHGSPFEHGYFRFRVKCPIFVAREWFRHRIGHSYNEWSGRYSKLETEFFQPAAFRRQIGKPGGYVFEDMDPESFAAVEARALMERADFVARDTYERLLRLGVAKEQARVFLPVGTYTRFIWSCNPRSLMHFLMLRTAPEAMHEIRQFALAAEVVFAERMPATHAAWVAADRRAP